MPLKSVIENNDWNVQVFVVESGATGYCSRSILCSFKSLGLRNCTINTIIKQLCKCSMECSCCIQLVRNNKAQSSKEIDLSLKTPVDPLVHQNPLLTTSKTNSLKNNSPLPIGFINKREYLIQQCHTTGTECLTMALGKSTIRVIIFTSTSKINYSEHENKIQI